MQKKNETNRDSRFNITDVLEEKICVGCGACATISAAHRMYRDPCGRMQVELGVVSVEELRTASEVCPFSDDSATEDELAEIFLDADLSRDRRIGRYSDLYAGRVTDASSLDGSSSGGLTSWLCSQLLREQLVDGVIHVGSATLGSDDLFQFTVSRSEDELMGRRKSQYYSASLDVALLQIRGDNKKYAFVGVPCYVKAIRNLCLKDAALRQQIAFTIGLVCGHMKSSSFAELLAWQVGVEPAKLARVNFRKKDSTKPVGQYKFAAVGRGGETGEQTSAQLVGGNWGHATMQLEACDYCDDIFAETADVVLGDAWLPKFDRVWQGTNIVVVREKTISAIFERHKSTGELHLEPLGIDELAESQGGNFRHRWDGLSVRLADDLLAGKKRPVKRILAGSRSVDPRRVAIVRHRQRMASASHVAFSEAKSKNSLQHFLRVMAPLAAQMNLLYRDPLMVRALRKARKVFKKIAGQ